MPDKRSQAERLTIAESLLSGVWDEIERGKIDDGVLQLAVNSQIMCNRIVWKLNELNNKPADKRQVPYDLLYEEGGPDA